MRSTETGLFAALEAALKAASEPLDCNMLFDMASIKEHANAVTRVSDYLGNMWRKGLVTRLPAPRGENNRARWLYAWKGNKGPKYLEAVDYAPRVLADRPTMLVTEEGNVLTLEFPNLIISIRQKPGK